MTGSRKTGIALADKEDIGLEAHAEHRCRISDVQSTGPTQLRGFSRNFHCDWLAVLAVIIHGAPVQWKATSTE
jgi:hypothetical protein